MYTLRYTRISMFFFNYSEERYECLLSCANDSPLSIAIGQLFTEHLYCVGCVKSSGDERRTVYGWARDIAQLVECFLGLRGQLDSILSNPHNPGAVVHTYNPSIQEWKEEKSKPPLAI